MDRVPRAITVAGRGLVSEFPLDSGGGPRRDCPVQAQHQADHQSVACGCRIGYPCQATWAYSWISSPGRSWHRRLGRVRARARWGLMGGFAVEFMLASVSKVNLPERLRLGMTRPRVTPQTSLAVTGLARSPMPT